MQVLLVEDEDAVGRALTKALGRRGFAVRRLATGGSALTELAGVDVVLLDLVLPDVDGLALCRRIRAVSDVPIIVVSALDGVPDRILALHAGADDYLVKGYDVGELVARIWAVRRRGMGAHGPISRGGERIVVGDVEIHLLRHEVSVAGGLVPLSNVEFRLLSLLAEAGGVPCTRERILAELWDDTSPGHLDELARLVAALRDRLDRPWVVETVNEVGYRLGRPGAGPDSTQSS